MLNLFLHDLAFSQNLVPNPGFEIIDSCNLHVGAIFYGQVSYWDKPTWGSPDAFNACTPLINSVSVPSNTFGFQYPHSGNGYAGETFYSHCCAGSVVREYMQVELDTALIAQQVYCASYYIVLGNKIKIANNNFGMYFSNTHVYIGASFNGILNFIPQINDTNIVTDTLSWKLISGNFIAQGGERYLIIGNFYADSLTDTVPIIGTDNESYYYIDDVNVHCCSCDTTSHIGINEITDINTLTISPNPANSEIKITTNDNLKLGEVKIYNSIGACVLLSPPLRGGKEGLLDISSLPQGLYFIEVITHKGIQRKKFVKQ